MNRYQQDNMSFKIISISLPPKDHTALKARLTEVGMTRSEYVRSLLRKDWAKKKGGRR